MYTAKNFCSAPNVHGGWCRSRFPKHSHDAERLPRTHIAPDVDGISTQHEAAIILQHKAAGSGETHGQQKQTHISAVFLTHFRTVTKLTALGAE